MNNRHAYCIIAHQDPLMLHVLVAMLDHPLNDIYIHIDKRTDIRPFLGIQANWSQVTFLPKRIRVEWGSTKQIETELLIFEYAQNHGTYSYYHMMSGLDLPLQSQNHIHDFFDNQRNGVEFVNVNKEDDDYLKDLEYKTCYYHYFVRSLSDSNRSLSHYWHYYLHALCVKFQMSLGIRRGYPFELKKGSNWVSITDRFVSYLLCHKEEISRTFRNTLCGDEIFLQSFLWNSPFRKNLFPKEGNFSGGNMREIKWINHKPHVWVEDEYDYLISSGQLFARKFTSQDRVLLLKLSQHNDCYETVKRVLEGHKR